MAHKSEKGWTKKWDRLGLCPYTYKGHNWVGYENEESVVAKMNWLKLKGYLGAMVWSLDLDDFNGVCGKEYPLLNAVHRSLENYTVPDSNLTTPDRVRIQKRIT